MEILIQADRIQARVKEIAHEIGRDYDQQPLTILGVLTGCLMFVADLVRHLNLAVRIGLIQASSYRNSATSPGPLFIRDELCPDIQDRHVLLVDDILDTGQTLCHLHGVLSRMSPRSLKTAVLLRKLGRQSTPFEPDYCGFEIPNRFVIGYGLDFNDEYRHLPFLAVLQGRGEPDRNA